MKGYSASVMDSDSGNEPSVINLSSARCTLSAETVPGMATVASALLCSGLTRLFIKMLVGSPRYQELQYSHILPHTAELDSQLDKS